jgi:hypothetical protein
MQRVHLTPDNLHLTCGDIVNNAISAGEGTLGEPISTLIAKIWVGVDRIPGTIREKERDSHR